jgi:hypothetical protein
MLRHKTRFHVMLNINNIKNNGNWRSPAAHQNIQQHFTKLCNK